MGLLDKIARQAGLCASDAASIAKVALLSRRSARPHRLPGDDEIVILGNGPSLRETIDKHFGWLSVRTLMAVNFAANTPDFARLQPQRYILADPHFFDAVESDSNVGRLWKNLREARHDMTLHVPAARVKQARALVSGSSLQLETFNLTPVEGHGWLTRILFDMRLGMPRPRNVMIAAVMAAIGCGYRRIYLAGADHSWSRTLSVDDDNRVVSIQPHFYSDDSKERERVATEYAGYHLHDILNSLTVAFRSYHEIRRYAEARGVAIANVTPGSMIDAFPRMNLDTLPDDNGDADETN